MDADPSELENLIANLEYAKVPAKMRTKMEQLYTEANH